MNQIANMFEYMGFHGQSNMAGNQDNSTLPVEYSGNISNCYQFSDANSGNIPLNATGTNDFPRTIHGWDIYFLRDLQLLLNTKIYQFKIAYGGTAINPSRFHWYPGGAMISDLEGQWGALKKKMSLESKSAVCKYVFYSGGETDAIDNISAADFGTYLGDVVNELRSIYCNPDIIIFNTLLSVNQTALTTDSRNAINLGFTDYGLTDNKFININTDNCEVSSDLMHYSENGYRQLATNVLNTFVANVKIP